MVKYKLVNEKDIFGAFSRSTLQYFVSCIKADLETIKDVGEYDKRSISLRKLEDYIARCWE